MAPMWPTIPYFKPPTYTLANDIPVFGTIQIGVFGPLVVLGIFVGMHLCGKFAKQRNMNFNFANDVMMMSIYSGFFISHIFAVVFYEPAKVANDPLVLLRVWEGLSSVGGLFGFMVGVFWFLRKYKQPFLIYVDMLCFGMLAGFTFGRLGCSLVHDHPGVVAKPDHPFYFLAVENWNYTEGLARFDLGIIEFSFMVVFALCIHLFFPWRTSKPGKLVGTCAIIYGIFRFPLDYLRVIDERYLGLTPAQYLSLTMVAIGVYLLFIRRPKAKDTEWMGPNDPYKTQPADDTPAPAETPA